MRGFVFAFCVTLGVLAREIHVFCCLILIQRCVTFRMSRNWALESTSKVFNVKVLDLRNKAIWSYWLFGALSHMCWSSFLKGAQSGIIMCHNVRLVNDKIC